jgi:hypothetical protein
VQRARTPVVTLFMFLLKVSCRFKIKFINVTRDKFTSDESRVTSQWHVNSRRVWARVCVCVSHAGVCGNALIIWIICSSPQMRTVTNYFIVNLASADILICLVCLPITLLTNLFSGTLQVRCLLNGEANRLRYHDISNATTNYSALTDG